MFICEIGRGLRERGLDCSVGLEVGGERAVHNGRRMNGGRTEGMTKSRKIDKGHGQRRLMMGICGVLNGETRGCKQQS